MTEAPRGAARRVLSIVTMLVAIGWPARSSWAQCTT